MSIEPSNQSKASTTFKPYRLIHEVYVLSDACDRQVLSDFFLNNSQYRVLAALDLEGQRMTLLGESLMLSKSSITRIVDQLEERGWVKRIPDPDDRRAQDVILTPDGARKREEILSAHRQSLMERMTGLSEKEQSQLIQLLEKLSTGLRDKIEEDRSNGSSS